MVKNLKNIKAALKTITKTKPKLDQGDLTSEIIEEYILNEMKLSEEDVALV